MSNNIFVIADTHFGHKEIIKFEYERRRFNSIQEQEGNCYYCKFLGVL